MKANQKSLQKLSDLEAVNKVIALKKITKKDYDHFTPEQSNLLNSELQRIANAAKTPEEKNALFDKIEAILDNESRNHRWQANHTAIQAAIANLLQKLNRMPAVSEIAEDTGLSRQTINKHLKNFDTQELYQQEWNKLRYASVNILGTVMKLAIKGDMRAARLYFDIISSVPGGQATYIKNQQNNYLTINSVKLDEATLNSLPLELLTQIEQFVKNKQLSSCPTELSNSSDATDAYH